jgi:uncharacterized membrane protein/mono/diheme cytochrome c family protein
MSGPPEIVLFFGRLHPLLVHLPIGLIVLLAVLEWLARYPRFKNANASARFILALAVPLALFTVLCGWLLSLGGNYGPQLLKWHKWTGIGTAAMCAVAGLFYSLDKKRMYRICLFSSIAVLILASHFGGSLTHGSDYLVRYAPQPLRKWFGGASEIPMAARNPKQVLEMKAFAGIVQPVLQQDCVSCHGAEKAEGELRLDSLAGMLKGGKSGPALVAGKSADSTLIKRLRLPVHEKEHMPPEGKPQPGADQITLVQWWIDSGADADKSVAELRPPMKVLRTLQARYGAPLPVAKAVAPKPLAEVQATVAKLTDELGISLTPLSPAESWLQCNAGIAGTNFGDAELARLAPLAANLRWLDLGGTRVSDAGLGQIAAMPNLVRLHLERTPITDAGLVRLAPLAELSYLNIYGTEVTDKGLEPLQQLPKLRQIYLWQTKVTPTAAKAFADTLTDKDQLQRWQEEIDQLKAKIKTEEISVDLGVPITTGPVSNAVPTAATNPPTVNARCPVTDKPVDLTKTVIYKRKLIGFCCDDCKAKFQENPEPLLAKLGLSFPAKATKPKKN